MKGGGRFVIRKCSLYVTSLIVNNCPLIHSIWPAVLRQSTYGTIKFGTYYSLKRILIEHNNGKESVSLNLCCAVIAGAISSAIANPTDVLKVRMQVQGPHSNIGLVGCFKDVYIQEGISGLWRVSFYRTIRKPENNNIF